MIQSRLNVGGSIVREVAEASPTLRQGMALEAVLEEGVGKVTQSTGAAGGVFAGFAYNEYKPQDRAVAAEEFVATGTTFKLHRQAIAGEALLYDVAAGTSDPATLTDAQVVTGLNAGSAYKVVYAYVPSAMDLYADRNMLGEGTPGFVGSDIVNSVSVAIDGDVWIDYFDINTDFSTVVPKAGADGLLSDSGVVIPGCYVLGLPSPNDPLLGIYFRA